MYISNQVFKVSHVEHKRNHHDKKQESAVTVRPEHKDGVTCRRVPPTFFKHVEKQVVPSSLTCFLVVRPLTKSDTAWQ